MKSHILICTIFVTFFHHFAFAKAEDMSVRIAIFNVSMEATNYVAQGEPVTGKELSQHLKAGNHPQINNIAEIIQRVRPDIILLNEFDYSKQSSQDITWFINNYLKRSQAGKPVIDYPYSFAGPVNTGVDSGLDLDGDGKASGVRGDAFGFGFYPGHYGMAVLSKFPIEEEQLRTFQTFLWKDMPDNLLATIKNEDGSDFYSKQAQQILRLSSKSHWDVPIKIGKHTLHILASHPTPPVFDGFEDRNGKRNFDEIRFWTDYISANKSSVYIYDDNRQYGGLAGKHFIVAGDLNASPDEGSAINSGIAGLIAHPRVNDDMAPKSEGGRLHSPDNVNGIEHTAAWRMRVDYVLPSSSVEVVNSGVFWPTQDDPLFRLIKDRQSSSDHRLVWIDVKLTQ